LLQLAIIAPMLQLRYFVVDKTGAVLRSDNFAGCKIVVLCQLQHSRFLLLMFYAIEFIALAHHSQLRRQSAGAACILVIVFSGRNLVASSISSSIRSLIALFYSLCSRCYALLALFYCFATVTVVY
jgi:hypothetical protein